MYFNTNDIYLAGFLQASGHLLCGHHREGRKMIFSFEETPAVKKLVGDYYNMNASINPLHYGSALKVLKNILYQNNYNDNYDTNNTGKIN